MAPKGLALVEKFKQERPRYAKLPRVRKLEGLFQRGIPNNVKRGVERTALRYTVSNSTHQGEMTAQIGFAQRLLEYTSKGIKESNLASDDWVKKSLQTIDDGILAANAKQMVAEIGARGPISGSICVTPEFEAYTGGIFEDTTGCTSLDHSISIAGYGTDAATGKDYWVVRNSWGTYWGERGWFRVLRGANHLFIEDDCAWAVPDVFTAGNPSFGTGPAGNFPCDEDGGNCKATA